MALYSTVYYQRSTFTLEHSLPGLVLESKHQALFTSRRRRWIPHLRVYVLMGGFHWKMASHWWRSRGISLSDTWGLTAMLCAHDVPGGHRSRGQGDCLSSSLSSLFWNDCRITFWGKERVQTTFILAPPHGVPPPPPTPALSPCVVHVRVFPNGRSRVAGCRVTHWCITQSTSSWFIEEYTENAGAKPCQSVWLGIRSLSVPSELVGNADCHSLPPIYRIRICILTGSPGDPVQVCMWRRVGREAIWLEVRLLCLLRYHLRPSVQPLRPAPCRWHLKNT